MLLVFQTNATPLAAQAQAPAKLKIVILEGEGAINNIRQRIAREPIVQVEDENDRPVGGAVVIFLLPDKGASGVFADGSRSLTILTDDKGQAQARGLRPNNVSGQLVIAVTASYMGRTASARILQSNAMAGAAAAGGSGKLIVAILAAAGAAAAVGAWAATRRGNGQQPLPMPTTITAGTGSVGPPR